jgi:uncharacterized protein
MKNSRVFFVTIFYGFFSWFRWLANGRNQQFTNSQKLPHRADTLADIKIDWLINYGIKGIILDLDNTIISEDDRYISPGAENWIEQAKLAGLVFFILSNGKRRYRVRYWSYRLKIQAINPARKPFPMAFKTAIAQMNLYPSQVVVIGDSVHTDIVGAWILGSSHIQVATLPHPPRWWEKLAGKWVQIPDPSTTELWDFEDVYSDECC